MKTRNWAKLHETDESYLGSDLKGLKNQEC